MVSDHRCGSGKHNSLRIKRITRAHRDETRANMMKMQHEDAAEDFASRLGEDAVSDVWYVMWCILGG